MNTDKIDAVFVVNGGNRPLLKNTFTIRAVFIIISTKGVIDKNNQKPLDFCLKLYYKLNTFQTIGTYTFCVPTKRGEVQ